jgi:hypothetical protein
VTFSSTEVYHNCRTENQPSKSLCCPGRGCCRKSHQQPISDISRHSELIALSRARSDRKSTGFVSPAIG